MKLRIFTHIKLISSKYKIHFILILLTQLIQYFQLKLFLHKIVM